MDQKYKLYLKGDVIRLISENVKLCEGLINEYEVDQSHLLFFCPNPTLQGRDLLLT